MPSAEAGRRPRRPGSTGPGRASRRLFGVRRVRKRSAGIVFPTNGFQFREGHLDQVEVGRVGRQEDGFVALVPQQREDLGGLARRQVVGRDDLSGSKDRGEVLRDAGLDAVAVHPAVRHSRCHQTMAANEVGDHRVDDRLRDHRRPSGPVGQHRAVEIDPLAAADFGWAVERELNFSSRICASIRFGRARACSARVKPDC